MYGTTRDLVANTIESKGRDRAWGITPAFEHSTKPLEPKQNGMVQAKERLISQWEQNREPGNKNSIYSHWLATKACIRENSLLDAGHLETRVSRCRIPKPAPVSPCEKSPWTRGLNGIPETIKLLEESREERFYDMGLQARNTHIKSRIWKWSCVKLKSFYTKVYSERQSNSQCLITQED